MQNRRPTRMSERTARRLHLGAVAPSSPRVEAERLLDRLVEFGGLDEDTAQGCRSLLPQVTPDSARWVSYVVDLDAKPALILRFLREHLPAWHAARLESRPPSPRGSVGRPRTLDWFDELHARRLVRHVRRAVSDAWPDVRTARSRSDREARLLDALANWNDKVNFGAALKITNLSLSRRPAAIADELIARMLGVDPRTVRNLVGKKPARKHA